MEQFNVEALTEVERKFLIDCGILVIPTTPTRKMKETPEDYYNLVITKCKLCGELDPKFFKMTYDQQTGGFVSSQVELTLETRIKHTTEIEVKGCRCCSKRLMEKSKEELVELVVQMAKMVHLKQR